MTQSDEIVAPDGRPVVQPHASKRVRRPLLPVQRASIAVFGPVGLVLAWLILTRTPDGILRWAYTPPILVLFLGALLARPRTVTQRLVTLALGLSALGDMFFVGFLVLPPGLGRLAGIGTFAGAYVVLTAAFWRGRPRASEARTGLLFVVAGGVLLIAVWPDVPDPLRVPVAVFAAVIVTMAWTTSATLARRWFPRHLARWAAATGVLLFLCDSLVALHMFHPAFDPPPPLTEATLRVSYLAGWLLMLLVAQEPLGSKVDADYSPAS